MPVHAAALHIPIRSRLVKETVGSIRPPFPRPIHIHSTEPVAILNLSRFHTT